MTMVLTACLAALAMFLLGLVFGFLLTPKASPAAEKTVSANEDGALQQLREEYSNFLSYDGSEQL